VSDDNLYWCKRKVGQIIAKLVELGRTRPWNAPVMQRYSLLGASEEGQLQSQQIVDEM